MTSVGPGNEGCRSQMWSNYNGAGRHQAAKMGARIGADFARRVGPLGGIRGRAQSIRAAEIVKRLIAESPHLATDDKLPDLIKAVSNYDRTAITLIDDPKATGTRTDLDGLTANCSIRPAGWWDRRSGSPRRDELPATYAIRPLVVIPIVKQVKTNQPAVEMDAIPDRASPSLLRGAAPCRTISSATGPTITRT